MSPAATTLAERVRNIPPPASSVRWLRSADDAAALRRLIHACYGPSYSYADLYRPGTIEAAWENGSLISLGEYVADGSLRGHTGFWAKDPAGHALESGLSLVDPQRRREARTNEKRVWSTLREGLAPLVSLVHQHTTTLHAMAQRYALRHMRAAPSGLIPFYACGESVLGLAESGADMHALCMTTRLRPAEALPPVVLPDGPWQDWLSMCAKGLGMATTPDSPETPAGAPHRDDMPVLEVNEALGLRRRRVTSSASLAREVLARAAAQCYRVELVHVAATAGITATSNTLRAGGFVPCGVHARGGGAPHDVVFVHAPDPARVAAAVRSATLATPELQHFWTTWCERCERTS